MAIDEGHLQCAKHILKINDSWRVITDNKKAIDACSHLIQPLITDPEILQASRQITRMQLIL